LNLPPQFHDLFWDGRPETLDTDRQAPFIVERLTTFLRGRGVRTLSRKTLGF